MVPEHEPEISFFASGYCEAHARIVNPETGRGMSKFFAVWALLRHPAFGIMLFDTGYTHRFHDATKSFPAKAYALMTPVTLNENDSARNQLMRMGIHPDNVDYIILSHFHADHIAGAADFPKSRFICSKEALDELKRVNGISAVRRGILKALLPEDFFSRVITIEEIGTRYEDENSQLTFYRFFHQEEFELVLLPGHACGMLGLKISIQEKNILFATDAAWDKECFDKNILPSRVVKLFFHSWNDFKSTITGLKKFEKEHPACRILFTHCPQTIQWLS